MKRCILAVPLVLLLVGCATPPSVGRLPAPAEFSKPVFALHNNYPDLKKLDPDEERRWWIGQGKMPYAEGLLEAWGEPTGYTLSMWNILPHRLIFRPRTYWIWTFEDKQIEAAIAHPLFRGYTPLVQFIDVRETSTP